MKPGRIVKGYKYLEIGEKAPRRVKLKILGRAPTKAKIQRWIRNFRVLYEDSRNAEYNMTPFCPDCGCTEFSCLRCDRKIGTADNSRFVHCLESKDLIAEV